MKSPIAIFTLPSLLLAFSAAQAETCVTCSGPAATYSCIVKKADQIRALAGEKAVSRVCATILRKKGSHAKCETAAGRCSGTETTIGWKDVKQALASGLDDVSNGKAATDAPVKASKEPDSVKAAPPATAPEAIAASRQTREPSVDDAAPSIAKSAPRPAVEEPSLGEKIKSGAEKSWKCVASLFGEC